MHFEKRRRLVSLAQMQALFDETHEHNVERRKAIAECMGLAQREAIEESRKRTEDEIT